MPGCPDYCTFEELQFIVRDDIQGEIGKPVFISKRRTGYNNDLVVTCGDAQLVARSNKAMRDKIREMKRQGIIREYFLNENVDV